MAERDFTEIARLSERYNNDPESRIFVQLADAYRKNNMIEEAFEVLQKGLEHHPDYPLAHLIMGKCRFDKRMYAQAKESFKKTLELDPQNVVALRMLAQTCEITNDEEGQIAAYKGLLNIDPFDDQAREKLEGLEATRKKEPMYTFAMADEYEKQGKLDKALEIYRHLQSTDPSDLVLQKRIKTIQDRIAEEKKTIEAKKIESMQVETVFKPEQIEERQQVQQRPEPPSVPQTPGPEIKEEVMPLEDFLAESKEGPAEPPQIQRPPQPPESPDKDIIDEKLDLLEPFKPEEPADQVEKLDILEPLEADVSSESETGPSTADTGQKEPEVQPAAPPEPVPQDKQPEPRKEPAAEQVREAPPAMPDKEPPAPEQTREDVIILQPPEEKYPRTGPGEVPEKPAERPPVPPAAPEASKPEAVTPAQTPPPTPEPEREKPLDRTPPAPAERTPDETPAPAGEAPSPPEKPQEPKKAKPKEEDFQSFQDWLSGLIK